MYLIEDLLIPKYEYTEEMNEDIDEDSFDN